MEQEGRLMILCLIMFSTLSAENLPSLAVIPVFPPGQYDVPALVARAGELYEAGGRFRVTDLSEHPGYSGPPETLAYRLREMAASSGVDAFMVLDVGTPGYDSGFASVADSLVATRTTSIDVAARFYTSDAVLMGTIRETVRGEGFVSSQQVLALRGVEAVVSRSMLEVFAMELTFEVGEGPLFTLPAGTDDGIRKGMIFSLVARASGVPQSRAEYERLQSRGILQITGASRNSSSGRLISGMLVRGSSVTAIETTSPANVFLQYAAVPVRIVPGDGLTGEEASDSRIMNQLEIGGWTSRWGLAFGGALVSGVLPRMSSIGVRGSLGARIPLSSPSLAFRVEAGVETDFLIQDTRADTVSASASAVVFGASAGVGLEWLFSAHVGLQGGVSAGITSRADSWSVQDWRGFNRDAKPGELYYAEVAPRAVTGRLGLFYMIF